MMDESGLVKNVSVSDEAALSKLQNSKYVQSFVGTTYQETKKVLESGKQVLYTGTPCQISGLYSFLGKKDNNLLSMDIVCHGVPSQDLFSRYRKWLEKKHRQKILSWDFRCKEVEGWGQIDKIRYTRKTKYQREFLNPFTRAFLLDYISRESCYLCKYACGKRVADITVGDYWGIRNVHPTFYSKKGVSLLLANTAKGVKAIGAISDHVELLPSSLSDMQKFNGNLVEPSKRPPKRDEIYRHLHYKPINRFVREDLKVPFDLKEHLRSCIPTTIRQKLIKYLGPLKPKKC
jgi:hypothetical protein